ncbi:restriction endonuclease [Nocardia sp. BSTN01]|uniref:restriction endonuclease n=1 Tax=Nocardia sp. BSTN01 TaxID=2783665 RepID=UPI00189054DE|nr:restriction endonuclease [Nocardia sp. BSTN01]MBF5000344.1 restriction endonuclease [Nocardia sp. BSTN01]
MANESDEGTLQNTEASDVPDSGGDLDMLPDDDDDEYDPGDVNVGTLGFDKLDPTDFEEFTADLLKAVGFINVDWRKGTPLNASPADRGRDIVAQLLRDDVDGHQYSETWFFDCKHYSRGVPPDVLAGSLAWAHSERPHVLVYVASGYFTNGAKDWAESMRQQKPPFRIRMWELPELRTMVSDHLDVAFRHDVEVPTLRRVSDILVAEAEITDKLWYGRKPDEDGNPSWWSALSPEQAETVRAGLRLMEEKYGTEELDRWTSSDFAWGELTGMASAIRWVLGYDWGNADS